RDARTLADFLPALDDDLVARFQSVGDFPLRIDTLAHLHRTKAGFVVLIDNRDLIVALNLVYRLLRNYHRAFLHIGHEPDFSELARSHNVSRIWKRHVIADRPSLR